MRVCVAEAHDMNQYHEDNEDGSDKIEIGISFHLIPSDLYVSVSVTCLSDMISKNGLFSERLVVPSVCEGKHLLVATTVAEGFYLVERTVGDGLIFCI